MKKLDLTLNGYSIPLPLGFSMRITHKSPVCNFESIPSGYGDGISFSINDYTRAIFGNPERFSKYRPSTATGTDQKFPGFQVRFAGALLMSGTLQITGASTSATGGGTYEGNMIDLVGVLGENEKERDILTFPCFTKLIAWTNSANFQPATHPYCCFPVVNTKFFREKGISITIQATANNEQYATEALSAAFFKPPVIAKVNALNVDKTVKCITTSFEAISYATLPAISVVSPFFFLQQIITEALKSVNFHVIQNAFNDSEILKMLCIYNNFDLTTNETVTETGVVDNEYIDYFGLDGADKPSEPTTTGYTISQYIRSYPPSLKPKDFLPKMKLGTLLLSTQNLLNLCFHFRPDNTVNVFSRDELISGVPIDLDSYFLGAWDIGKKMNVALNFTHEVDDNDLMFSERFQDIEDRIADVKEPVADGFALMAIADMKEGDIRFVKSSNNYMEFRMITIDEIGNEPKKDILGWDEYSIGFQNGWYNRGTREVEEIKTEWSTCYGNIDYTIVSQQGNMNAWKAKAQAFSPRLLIYKGNNTGGNESADFSLDYEKAGKGIIPTFWKKWAPFWVNRLEVTGRFDLPVNVLRHVIYNICNKYRTREGEFMIDEMSCDIYVDRIGETEIKGYKVE